MSGHAAVTRPSAKMIRLYHRLQALLGEPTNLVVFDEKASDRRPPLPLVHVPVWAADGDCDVTGLNTLGMSDLPMPGTGEFVELHLGFRGDLTADQRLGLARRLADLAQYPFEHGLSLDWWQIVRVEGSIPAFTGGRHLLLHPKLADGGIEHLEDEDGPVKLIYVVPITPYERHLLTCHGRSDFLRHIDANDVDLLADRRDPPEWDSQP